MTAELNAASNLADEINRAIKILESKNMFDESSEISESWEKTTKLRDIFRFNDGRTAVYFAHIIIIGYYIKYRSSG